jgi:hypothetical protein
MNANAQELIEAQKRAARTYYEGYDDGLYGCKPNPPKECKLALAYQRGYIFGEMNRVGKKL